MPPESTSKGVIQSQHVKFQVSRWDSENECLLDIFIHQTSEWKNYLAAAQKTPPGFQHENGNRMLRFQNFAIMKEIEDFK